MVDEQSGAVHFHKVPSTPRDPSEAIQQGISDMLDMHGVPVREVSHIGHGTTVATNLIIERKGAKVGRLTTKGFRDVIEIDRQTPPPLYNYGGGTPPATGPRTVPIT